jgi:hypothetical protein
VRNVPLGNPLGALRPILAGVRQVVSASQHIAASVVATVRDVVADTARAAQQVYQQALDTARSAVETVSNAARAAADWVVEHHEEIVAGAAGLTVKFGCSTLIGRRSVVGMVACGAIAGATRSLVRDSLEGGQSWREVGANALTEAALGAVTLGLAPVLQIIAPEQTERIRDGIRWLGRSYAQSQSDMVSGLVRIVRGITGLRRYMPRHGPGDAQVNARPTAHEPTTSGPDARTHHLDDDFPPPPLHQRIEDAFRPVLTGATELTRR